ncbi:MAG: gliding motility-associated C-terminal domain-containing protein [Bacteroidetes bacterium]|nr:gliding motility-associated C-terminal domain-containing protein [Bacteroidota bacterium]
MKYFSRLILSYVLVFSAIAVKAQHATNCPGVPGACGYNATNSTARSSGHQNTQDGNNTLGNTFMLSKCGLNYISISQRLGQRFTPIGIPQPAPYTISGLQTCDTIEKAYLYVEGSGTGAAQTVTIQPPAGGPQNFPLTVIGSGPDKCWGYQGTYTYRADVTSIISGNGTYNLSNVFTNPPTAGEDMDGATLIVIYSNRTQPWQGTLVIDDGCIEVSGGVANYNMNFPPVCGATTNATAFICVGDIQFSVTSLTMNGTPATFAWDWWNYVSVPTTVNAAQTTSNFNLNTGGDCFNLCVAGLYWQTTTCSVCPSGSNLISLSASSNPATCGNCDGSATITPTPAGSYTYSWSPSGGSAATATNLCSGTYTVTVGGGCIASTQTVSVGNSANLSATAAVNSVTCFGNNDGTATVTPTGGTGPYTYNWSPSGGNGPTASGLSPGTYTCVVTDATPCTYNEVVVITQPPSMALTFTSTSPVCNGQSTGTAIVYTSGGNPTYNYLWSPAGGTNDTATGLAAGTYTVNVTDANGCSASQTFTLTDPPVLLNTMTTFPVGCTGPGSATANPSGGSSPYTYLWTDGSTSATDLNLSVGTYTVTITDANGCSIIDTAVITSVNPISIASSQTNITCNGNFDGTATAIPSGGTGPYTFFWSPTGGNNQTATNLAAGQYTCTITDANGCNATQIFMIIEPPAITSTLNVLNVSCFGNADGSASMVVNGGSPPYSYTWSPSGGPGPTSNGLPAGSYTVTATDTSGCAAIQTFQVTQPTQLNVTMTPDSICPGGNATVTANANGGVGPYFYSWADGGNGSSHSVNPVVSTTYTVSVTDANGCIQTGTASVILNSPPIVSFTTNAVNGVFSLSAGNLCVTDNTTGAVQWSWNFNNTDTSTSQNPCMALTASNVGSYCIALTATNAAGCTSSDSTCIEVTNVSYSIPNVFTPNGDGNNDLWFITNSGMKTVHVDIYDRWGALVYVWEGPTGGWNGMAKNGKEATDGVYYFTAHMIDDTDKIYNEKGFIHLIRGN